MSSRDDYRDCDGMTAHGPCRRRSHYKLGAWPLRTATYYACGLHLAQVTKFLLGELRPGEQDSVRVTLLPEVAA